MSWAPVAGPLMTRWARDLSPDRVWPEYPRPQMVRSDWMSLNGLWEYAIVPRKQEWVTAYEGEILVPFPVESALSGVKRALLPDQRLWYRRSFRMPTAWQSKRLLLHFGAVDYEATVWVNGTWVGSHRGGFDPFSFDISSVVEEEDQHEVVVAVWDPTDRGAQARGKQVLEPGFIWYTAVSGIWQTVWLEPVPEPYLGWIRITPDIDAETVQLDVAVKGDPSGVRMHAQVAASGLEVSTVTGVPGEILTLPIPHPRLWQPDAPHLYDLRLSLARGAEVVDSVDSYFGMRAFGLQLDRKGMMRLCLNGEPLFHYGPLDQGYWPDGLYTPPSEEAMLFDLSFCKRLGFNLIRKHVKVEPARYYYHCDRLGLIVWQDMPNGARPVGKIRSFLGARFGLMGGDDRHYTRSGRVQAASRGAFRRELQAMVDALHNAPCVGMWVPFNEGWGQFDALAIAGWLKGYDPTRPVDHASGWFDQGGGDFLSIHSYFHRLRSRMDSRRDVQRGTILSEFGGYSLQVENHLWDSEQEFGYNKFQTSRDLTDAYVSLLEDQLLPWVERGLSGAVYTQTTDVEIEVNGFLTYDRAIVKMDEEPLVGLHRRLIDG